ncbi:MAG: hypothetical protein ABS917_03495 [Solibacillus sp.]|uniref:hypothetical protein n=1 Tax=Solibacillus sp. TaxID=1909654 RepID=UPI003314E67A
MTSIVIQSQQEIVDKVSVIDSTAHQSIVSYDTLELNAKLSYTQIKEFFSVIDESNFYVDKNYRYVFHDKERGFTLKMLQHDSARQVQYNAKITIHRAFYETSNTGYLLEIINLYRDKWCVKKVDVAFDFLSNRDNSLIIKHHLNVKGTKLTDLEHHVTDYTGSLKYSNRAGARLVVNYDRNEREQARNNESDYTFANRLEVRMAFKTDEIMFKAFANNDEQAHGIISKHLEGLLFIVDLDSMVECSAYLLRSFKAIQRDTNKVNEYKKRKSKNKLLAEIKRVAKVNRFNFELAYGNNRSRLTEPFKEHMSVDTDSKQLA